MNGAAGPEADYWVLGVKPGASLEEIKEAHRDLVKVWHPDRFAADDRLRRKADDQLKRINAAYQRLSSHLHQRPSVKERPEESRRPEQPRSPTPPPKQRPARTAISCVACGRNYRRPPKAADACDWCKREFTASEFLNPFCVDCCRVYFRKPSPGYSVLTPRGEWVCGTCGAK